MDRRRLHDRLRRVPADRRQHRRPSRPAAVLRHRSRDLRRRVACLFPGRLGHRLDPLPGGAGLRRGVHHAGHAVHHRQRLHRRAGARAGDRPVGRRLGARRGHRPACRRLPARALLVGLDLPRQRTDRHRDDRRGTAHRARVEGPPFGAARHRRDGAVDGRVDHAALRGHRRAGARLDRRDGARIVRRGGGPVDHVRLLGTAHRLPDPRHQLLLQPALHGGVDRGHARLLRDVRLDVLRQPVPAVRTRVLGAQVRRGFSLSPRR